MTRTTKKPNKHVPLAVVLAEYWPAIRQHWFSGVLLMVCYGIATVLEDLALPYVLKLIIDAITVGDRDAVWQNVLTLFLWFVVLQFLYRAFFRFGDFLIAYFQIHVMRALDNQCFRKLQLHSYRFFSDNFVGSLVTKVRRFVNAFETIHDQIAFNFSLAAIQLIGVTILFWFELPKLALFFVVWTIIYLAITYILTRYKIRFDLAAAAADSKVTGRLADVMTNVVNLKVFSAVRRESRAYWNVTTDQLQKRSKSWYFQMWIFVYQGIAVALLEVIGMWIALVGWHRGAVTAGTVVLVQALIARVTKNLWMIGRAMTRVTKALSDAEEMVAILQQPIDVRDATTPEPSRMREGNIVFDHVNFSYPGGVKVFEDFSLTIPSGQRVGVVGHSGGGKSTLFKLILRFLDIQEGTIRIDGQDIREVRQDELRQAVSYVPQDPVLFHRPLLENIAYAKPGADQETIVAAAKQAQAHDFIEQLPEGYDTLVGERGIKLSGGERQRVAIARAILKDAPILLLDEATSALDTMSEQLIQEQLEHLMRSRTTLAIAHRISTIQQMDRIIVISGGAIVEDGSHDELIRYGQIYADLWSRQSQGFLVQ